MWFLEFTCPPLSSGGFTPPGYVSVFILFMFDVFEGAMHDGKLMKACGGGGMGLPGVTFLATLLFDFGLCQSR